MATTKKLYLIFGTETGGNYKVPVDNVKDNITLNDAKAVGDTLIEQNIFFSNSGDFVAFKGAQVITTTTEDLE